MPGNSGIARKYIVLSLVLLAGLLTCGLLIGCRNDFAGLVHSTDLDERLQERNSFRFLRPEDRELHLGEEYSFIVLTDIHIENKNARGLEKLTAVIAEHNIQFVVIIGDITQNGTREDIERFIEIARSFRNDNRSVPCYPVIGNHDIFFGNWPHWSSLIGSTRYRIDGGGATLFVLDSANAYLGRGQLNWLENELKSASGRVFVFTHSNLFIRNLGIQQLADARERARICAILHNRGDLMFMGHSHERDIRTVGGVQYISIEDFRDNQIYCLVTVKHTGISYRFEQINN